MPSGFGTVGQAAKKPIIMKNHLPDLVEQILALIRTRLWIIKFLNGNHKLSFQFFQN